jgi:cytochrome b pre-mRNA-processing protein 3
MRLTELFRKPPAPERRVYEAIVAAARHPRPYAEWGVPDTVDGRFDMISLYLFLVLDRLKGADAGFRQRLTDAFFADMDRSLREMGVGDLSVAKKIRKMAEVFYGRVAAYDAALAQGPEAMAAALARNVYAGAAPAGAAEALATHAGGVRQFLSGQTPAAIAAGVLSFPRG